MSQRDAKHLRCGSCGERALHFIVLDGFDVPACLRHVNVWRTPDFPATDRLATDTAAPEACPRRCGWNEPCPDPWHDRPAAPVAVEGVETVRVGFRYQDGEVLSPEREGLSRDKELPVVVLDLGDGEWLTLSEVRSLSPVEPETSEPEGGESNG